MEPNDIISRPKQYYERLHKESITCDLCGSQKHKILYIGDRYGMGLKTVYCRDCGLIFANPRPVNLAIETFYRSYYRLFYEAWEKPSLSYIRNGIFEKRAQNTYAVLHEAIHLSKVRKILDIGCSEGSLLKYIGERHPEVELEGIEPVPAFAEFAVSYASANIYTGDLQAYLSGNSEKIGTFDVIILSHVLEHLASPSTELRKIWGLLRDDGYLYVEVPNLISPYGGLGQFHIAHLYYFYPETLRAMLLKCGFHPVMIKDEGLADKWAMGVVARKSDEKRTDVVSSGSIQQSVTFIQNKLPPRTFVERTYKKLRYLGRKFMKIRSE